jgi:hypothetical protein
MQPTFAALCEAMDAAGVEVLVDERRGRHVLRLVDWGRCRDIAVPVPPRGFDAAVAVLCCSLALGAEQAAAWPELLDLAAHGERR